MTLSALHTDLYQLTMLAGYFRKGMHRHPATFDLFFRQSPFRGGFAIFAGLQPALDYLEKLRFTDDEISYLARLDIFDASFLDALSTFRFRGEVTAPAEGTLVFPNEPLLTVSGELAETQLVETALLNTINFQTLAATKAARISLAAGDAEIIEFGLRRAQGPDGGLGLARAASIGGVTSTSNVLAGKTFDLPVRGTHAHSWVMAHDDELSAFRAYAEVFPDSCVLLVDTYDTLSSGLPNALTVARELRENGHVLKGIRLDSGDIAELSLAARRMFDDAGFPDVKIVASNDLDEESITAIRNAGGRVDIYGVGTRLATCAGSGGGALGGVYKLVSLNGRPRQKSTSDPDKSTLPGTKQIYRFFSADNTLVADLLTLADEPIPDIGEITEKHGLPKECRIVKIRETVMLDGKQSVPRETLSAMSQRRENQMETLTDNYKQPAVTQSFPVYISEALVKLQQSLAREQLTDS